MIESIDNRCHYEYSNIIGVQISAINMAMALECINKWVQNDDRSYITVVPAHSLLECRKDPNVRKAFNQSNLTTPDGMPLVWILQRLGHKNVDRVYGPDLFEAVCQLSSINSFRVFLYGGKPNVVSVLAATLKSRYPDLLISGYFSPPFRELNEAEDRNIINLINKSSSNIVIVGLGSPKQELWMANHVGKINAQVMIGVGAAFDFVSGNKPQAPHWVQRSGFEWLFRLASEPKRLWPRYRQYPLFVWLVLLQLLGLKEFPIE